MPDQFVLDPWKVSVVGRHQPVIGRRAGEVGRRKLAVCPFKPCDRLVVRSWERLCRSPEGHQTVRLIGRSARLRFFPQAPAAIELRLAGELGVGMGNNSIELSAGLLQQIDRAFAAFLRQRVVLLEPQFGQCQPQQIQRPVAGVLCRVGLQPFAGLAQFALCQGQLQDVLQRLLPPRARSVGAQVGFVGLNCRFRQVFRLQEFALQRHGVGFQVGGESVGDCRQLAQQVRHRLQGCIGSLIGHLQTGQQIEPLPA